MDSSQTPSPRSERTGRFVASSHSRRSTARASGSRSNPPESRPQSSSVLPDFKANPVQSQFLESTARFRVLATAARCGKTTALLYELIRSAIVLPKIREESGTAPLFPKFWAWFCCPTYNLCRPAWRQFKAMLPRELLPKPPNETTLSVELVNGAFIEFKSTDNPEGLFGSGLDLVCCDEAAMIDDEAWQEALRPRLASYGRTGLAAIASTPKGQRGWFHEMYLAGQDANNSDVWSMQAAMKDSGMVSDAEIESLRATMTQLAFEQEVLGQFITDSGAVFRNIEGCRVEPREPAKGGTVGIDLASRRDRTACLAIDPTGHLFSIDFFTGMSWERVKQRIRNFIESVLPVERIRIERNGVGDPIFEEMEREFSSEGITVEGFLTTSNTKRQIVESLALAIENKNISWSVDTPHVRAVENELALFEYTSNALGTLRFAGRGSAHDDLVMATALAWSGCDAAPRRGTYAYVASLGDDGIEAYGPDGALYAIPMADRQFFGDISGETDPRRIDPDVAWQAREMRRMNRIR
jgi:hypothetical protein